MENSSLDNVARDPLREFIIPNHGQRWIISITTLIPIAYANRSLLGQGLMCLGLMIGTLVAEAFFSGRLEDEIIGRIRAEKDSTRDANLVLECLVRFDVILISPSSSLKQYSPVTLDAAQGIR
ncbi:hypothetical protein N7537_005578 [Penicillium hordei]|uniref:Uncharacterized protein n=1 Tax=Penicillium hordei TaxID=40994 RepID=A0AAD6H3A8_9EURO|nr:uncharacterized protein N7537_005578 [Penicillium hordei]KAJ5602622.1 hypothetical protein N7537_005578 [Penicillium hordei]